MGRKFRPGHGLDEVMLMPADPRDWLPPGHLAWKVLDLAGETGLPGFGARYRPDGQGGRPYHPQVMAALLLYCWGRKSSREIEMATCDDAGARIICGGLHPGHSTVAEFIRGNAEAVLGLLPESVKACAAEGPAGLSLAAGTKLKANAAMAGNLARGQLEEQIAELEAWIGAELREWVQDVLAAEGIPSPDSVPGGDGTAGGGGKRKWKSKPGRADAAAPPGRPRPAGRRGLHYRSDLADTELALWAASHNILKAITARTRRLARQARPATSAHAPAT